MTDGAIKESELPKLADESLTPPSLRKAETLKRASLGTRLALTGAALGIWGIGVATTFVESALAYQENAPKPAPTLVEKSTRYDYLLQTVEQPQTENQTQKVEIAPRIVPISQLPQLITALREDGANANQLLQQKKEELANKPTPGSEALNQIATYLEGLKQELSDRESDLKSEFEQEEVRFERNKKELENRLKIKISIEEPDIKNLLIDDLKRCLSLEETRKLYDRGAGEIELSEKILRRAQTEPEKQNAHLNLIYAQDQDNLIKHFYASLHHDLNLLDETKSLNRALNQTEFNTVIQHALERPNWIQRYWETEKERAKLGLDPNKESKEYQNWVENEYNQSFEVKRRYREENSSLSSQTPEGRLFSIYNEISNINFSLYKNQHILDRHKSNIAHQKNIYKNSALDIDEEWKFIDDVRSSINFSPDKIERLKIFLKSHALARAWNQFGLWEAEGERLQLLGQEQTEKGREVEKKAKEAYEIWIKLKGNIPFSIEGDLRKGLESLAAQLPDENFSGESEMRYFSSISESDYFPLAKIVSDLEIKDRSLAAEAQELVRIREGLNILPQNIRQGFKTLAVGIQPSSIMMSWSKFDPKWGDVYLNISGNTKIERQRRVELALEDLKSQLEGHQSEWAKGRLATIKKLYQLTDESQIWLDKISFRQAVGEPGCYGSSIGGVIVGQTAEIMSNLHELGHHYFHRHPLSVTDRPDLSWEDGTGYKPYTGDYGKGKDRSKMSSAYRQFLNDIDNLVSKQSAGDLEPLRRWLALWPDYHQAEADLIFGVMGHLKPSKDNPFSKYFDHFFNNGDFTSIKELAVWYETASPSNQRYVQMYINHDFLKATQDVINEDPAFRIELTPQRQKELENLFEQKKKILQQEEKQALRDFGDQLPIYLLNLQYDKSNPQHSFLNYWNYYLGRMIELHRIYPDFLKQTHPTAYEYLERYK